MEERSSTQHELESLRALPDEVLAARCVEAGASDDRYFAEFLRRYQRLVFSVCRRYSLSDSDAADLSQEIFVRAYRGLARFDGRSKLSSWIYRIAENSCQNEKRRRRRRPHMYAQRQVLEEASAMPNSQTAVDDALYRDQQAVLVDLAMQRLSEQEREVLEMAHFEELSISEICARLGIGKSAAKMRLHRARIALKRMFTMVEEEREDPS